MLAYALPIHFFTSMITHLRAACWASKVTELLFADAASEPMSEEI